ncbi:hypothetical protein BCR15_10875 [Tessaracoccus lapidicaptus]|uniref:Uncharacterized protein n=1 Tax=Tessaracoccus lapidicaptus TaxID=1427523 RepID=A0A1C0ASD4_9ACTN|nr:hypothetical protein BKM78_12545 [Tessaracoccus sp. T2.5-30]OCL37203.1 hypothetical protein BCR15_10875 [Tessaracoccus lapidicaptus]VEP41356.1 putative membrane protein YdfK [Tessaracoccus lapidicaptus]
MAGVFIGAGTVVNVITVVVGSLIGIALGNRIPETTKSTVTAVLGLVTLVLGGMSVVAMNSEALREAVDGAAMLVVLAALLVGALLGSWLRVEDRLEQGAGWVRARFTASGDAARFVDGMVTATLLFCVGPLAILGSLSDGLGRGADQLLVKSVLDGFAAMAFASTLGWGVLASAGAVALIQGSLTAVGYFAGDVLTTAQVDALTATGGVVLLALGLRLLDLKQIPVGDLLPALLLAPPLVTLAAALI